MSALCGQNVESSLTLKHSVCVLTVPHKEGAELNALYGKDVVFMYLCVKAHGT
jgi:hypothetical protein